MRENVRAPSCFHGKLTDHGLFLCPNRIHPSQPTKSPSFSLHPLYQGAKCFGARSVKSNDGNQLIFYHGSSQII